MLKIKSRLGFTLIEMLIVVAIIAILIAIVIPIFTSSLHAAEEAADAANVRGYYAYLQAEYMADGTLPEFDESFHDTITYPDGSTIKLRVGLYSIRVSKRTGGVQVAYCCLKDGHVDLFG